MLDLKDHNNEMPADFDNEIHKWALECKWVSIIIRIKKKRKIKHITFMRVHLEGK